MNAVRRRVGPEVDGGVLAGAGALAWVDGACGRRRPRRPRGCGRLLPAWPLPPSPPARAFSSASLLRLRDLLLQLRGAHLDALDDPEHPLVDLADHLLTLFRRELLPLLVRADQLLNHLAPDRHHVELDAVLLGLGVGGRAGRRRRRSWRRAGSGSGGIPAPGAEVGPDPVETAIRAADRRARSRAVRARGRDRSGRRESRRPAAESVTAGGWGGTGAERRDGRPPTGRSRAAEPARARRRVHRRTEPAAGVPTTTSPATPTAAEPACRRRGRHRVPGAAPGGGPPCRRPRTSMLFRSIATSPSAAATDSSRVDFSGGRGGPGLAAPRQRRSSRPAPRGATAAVRDRRGGLGSLRAARPSGARPAR